MSTTRTSVLSSTTNTITVEKPDRTQTQTLVLRLIPRKKMVTWKEGTVDNEFMGKKSSKKCCIFHKQKSFDEDTSDGEEEYHHHHHHDCNSKGGTSSSN